MPRSAPESSLTFPATSTCVSTVLNLALVVLLGPSPQFGGPLTYCAMRNGSPADYHLLVAQKSSLTQSPTGIYHYCRTHFYKILFCIIFVVMVLQYALSALYGTALPVGQHVLNRHLLEPPQMPPVKNGSWTTSGAPKGIHGTMHSVDITTNVTNGMYRSDYDSLPECDQIPPKLVGPVRVWTEAPSFDTLAQLYPELAPGGRFRPRHCRARHRVAIIIPYRDREQHLRMFLHNIHPILERQYIDYGIFVVEEAGETKFNRALLMNIGYAEANKLYDWQCYIFHDVDLLPEDDRNIYSCPEQPRHMSVAVDTMSYKLPYRDIFGGVSALTKDMMVRVNGFSNEFWGWGGEDDDMSSRIRYHGYKISRYPATVARYKMMKHTKDKPNPERYNRLYKGKQRYKSDGINSLRYKVLKVDLRKLYTLVVVDVQDQWKHRLK